MPETDPEVIEASQEEEAGPRGNDSAEVRRERETPGRALDLPEAMFPGETREFLHGRPFDPMAVRAAIIPVEEFRMEELLSLARPGEDRLWQAASLHVDAHRGSVARQVGEASRGDPGSRTHFDEDRVRSVQEGGEEHGRPDRAIGRDRRGRAPRYLARCDGPGHPILRAQRPAQTWQDTFRFVRRLAAPSPSPRATGVALDRRRAAGRDIGPCIAGTSRASAGSARRSSGSGGAETG